MAPKSKIQFCKNGEQCPVCIRATEVVTDPDDEESLIVTCALEINKGAEEIEGDSCPSFQAGMNKEDIEPMSEDAVKKIIEGSKKNPKEDKEYEETKKMYAYRGDLLVEVINPTSGQTSYMLFPTYVEFYNLQVQGKKQEIKNEIERLQGRLTQITNELRNAMIDRGDEMTEDDVIMIVAPETLEETEDEEEPEDEDTEDEDSWAEDEDDDDLNFEEDEDLEEDEEDEEEDDDDD